MSRGSEIFDRRIKRSDEGNERSIERELSDLSQTTLMPANNKEVIAITISDVHLSPKAPSFRSTEPDWYAYQDRVLDQVNYWSEKYEVPVLAAGDICDYWLSPPEMINRVSKKIKGWYSIPGQHDLPNHQYHDIHRSAYQTLVDLE